MTKEEKEEVMRLKEEAMRLFDIFEKEEAEGKSDPWYVRDTYYSCKAKLIKDKYESTVEGFKDEHDDRRVAYNIYHQILGVCNEMARIGTESRYIKWAVYQALQEDMDTIDEIVSRFKKDCIA